EKQWHAGEKSARAQVDNFLKERGLTLDAITAQTLSKKLDDIERIDRMIANAEARRHVVLREIDRRRPAVAARLRAAADGLIASADAETALGVPRLSGELERTCAQWELYAQATLDGEPWDLTIDTRDDTAQPTPRPDLRRMNRPLGPIAVYAASNFPFAFSVAGTDTAAAIAAGCPVIVKAHEGHPATSAATAAVLAEAFAESGTPSAVFDVVYGFDAGVALITHPAVKAAAFTGSQSGGRALFDAASRRDEPIPFYGELGSLNPAVLTRSALAKRGGEIAAEYAASFALGSGQFCTKPGLLLLPAGHGLSDPIAAAVRQTKPHPLLHQGIADGFAASVARLANHPGVETVVAPMTGNGDGFAVEAGLFAITAEALLPRPDELFTECFGPVSVLVSYADDAELADVLAALPGGLTGSVHIGDDTDPQAAQVIDRLSRRCGRVIVNQWPTGVAVTWGMQHGGPWPATTMPTHTSVGQASLRRFVRPVAFQNVPQPLLPEALRDGNPW
ncbi:MAG: aldehyde dehydrogenase (NADP(+)), partial [Stackebrandtia sp.]